MEYGYSLELYITATEIILLHQMKPQTLGYIPPWKIQPDFFPIYWTLSLQRFELRVQLWSSSAAVQSGKGLVADGVPVCLSVVP